MTVGGETIVGLTSYGDVACEAGGYDTRVDAMAAWIDGFSNKRIQVFPWPSAAVPSVVRSLPDVVRVADAPRRRLGRRWGELRFHCGSTAAWAARSSPVSMAAAAPRQR